MSSCTKVKMILDGDDEDVGMKVVSLSTNVGEKKMSVLMEPK